MSLKMLPPRMTWNLVFTIFLGAAFFVAIVNICIVRVQNIQTLDFIISNFTTIGMKINTGPDTITILVAVGTRPEAIKLAPIIRLLRKNDHFNTVVLSTGQHKELLRTIDLHYDIALDVMIRGQPLNILFSSLLVEADKVLATVQPDIVMVQGDTTTAAAVGVAAFQRGKILAHVEAGLRTYRLESPFPEEFNRQMIGLVACIHFTPTEHTKQFLLGEGVDARAIYTVGNSGIDSALYQSRVQAQVDMTSFGGVFPAKRRSFTILLTSHRSENHVHIPQMLQTILRTLQKYEHVVVLFPVHPNPRVRKAVAPFREINDRLKCVGPLDYHSMIYVLQHVDLVVTDSGGLQEEGSAFAVPVIVLREFTERPEAIMEGVSMLVPDRSHQLLSVLSELVENTNDIYSRMSQRKLPFGDGHTAERIVEVMMGWEKSSACPWHREVQSNNKGIGSLPVGRSVRYRGTSANFSRYQLFQKANVKDPVLTIILPVHNGEQFLKFSLTSIMEQQTSFTYEVVVVDDASTDRSSSIIAEMTTGDPRVTIVRHWSNLQLPNALNTGLLMSRGKWLTWTSDDNIYSIDFVERMLLKAADYPDAGIITGAYVHITENGDLRSSPLLTSDFSKGAYEMTIHWSGSPVFMFPKAVRSVIGNYNASLLSVEDVDHMIRILELFPTYVSATNKSSIVMKYRKHKMTMTERMKKMWPKKWSLLCDNLFERGGGRLTPWRMLPYARYSLDAEADYSHYLEEMKSMLPRLGDRCVQKFRNDIAHQNRNLSLSLRSLSDTRSHRISYFNSLNCKIPHYRVLVVVIAHHLSGTLGETVEESFNPMNFFHEVHFVSIAQKSPLANRGHSNYVSSPAKANVISVSDLDEARRRIRKLNPMLVHAWGGGLVCDEAVESSSGEVPVVCSVESYLDCCGSRVGHVDQLWSGSRAVAAKLIEVSGVHPKKIFGFYTSPPTMNWDPQLLTTEVLERWQVSLYRIAYDQFHRNLK